MICTHRSFGTNRSHRMQRQRGMALIMTLLALMLLSGIGLGLMYMADTETVVGANYRDAQDAYFAARAGIEEARQRMFPKDANPLTLPTTMPTNSGGVIYIINKGSSNEDIQPWNSQNAYFDTELCHQGFYTTPADPGANIPCTAAPSGTYYTVVNSTAPNTGTTAALAYKWVRVTLKGNLSGPYPVKTGSAGTVPVCWTGTSESVPSGGATTCAEASMQQVYIATALAVTKGGTRRMVQQEIVKTTLPPMPSALTMDGPIPIYAEPSLPDSKPFVVNGNDKASCGTAHPAKPAIGTVDDMSTTNVKSVIPKGRTDNYIGYNGTTPNVYTLMAAALNGLSTPQELEDLADMVQQNADQVTASAPADLGSDSNPKISVITGNADLSGAVTGAGILLVRGTLNTSGNTSFNGIVLVIGSGVWNCNGGGNGSYNGATLVAKTRDDKGNTLSTLGNPILNWAGGGGNGIFYDSCWVDNAMNKFGYMALAFRELMY